MVGCRGDDDRALTHRCCVRLSQVYEGGDSDYDSPKGVSRAKPASKGWSRSVRGGNHDRAGPGSTHHDNGGGLNAGAHGLSQHSWDSGSPVTSPRLGAGGPPGPGPGSGVSLRTKGHATATSRRTSLWGGITTVSPFLRFDLTKSQFKWFLVIVIFSSGRILRLNLLLECLLFGSLYADELDG